MALLQTFHINKTIITQTILKDVSLQIMPREKVGLIGLNGVGKTTLFHLFLGEDEPDTGEIQRKNGIDIGYMAQDFFLRDEEMALYDFMLQAFQHLVKMEETIRSLEKRMGEEALSRREEERKKIMEQYAQLTHVFEEEGGYEYESRIRGVLKGLGFPEESFASPLSILSGGEKSRAELGRLLLTEPDLLLLDEPTNHLDIRTREWLEEYLATYRSAMIIISHDRYFLNKTVNRLWELYNGHVENYPGDYSFYLKEKERRALYQQKEHQRQKEHIAKQEEYIRKNHAGNNSGQARSRKKLLESLERIPPPPPPPSLPHISFLYSGASGRRVLEIEDLCHSFDEKEIFSQVNLQVFRGEKIALLGDNGSGKTTLFKILLSMLAPTRGEIKTGVNVKTAFYLQEHENLSKDRTILEEMLSIGKISYEEARRVLGGLLFTSDDLEKQVGDLSGGERSRLALARLSVEPSNLLLLDEPTNHLDILSRGRLEKAVKTYEGTCIIISHDRFFIDEVAHKVWELQGDSIKVYHGDYSYYKMKKGREREEAQKRKLTKKERRRKPPSRKRKEASFSLEELEEQIILLEEEMEELEKEFTTASFFEQQGEVIKEKRESYTRIQNKLQSLYQKWGEEI